MLERSAGRVALQDLLARPKPLLVGGAHDGLSSILVREAGFDAVWASGFEISASHGVPDANILTMSENLRAAAQMVEAAGIPVIADCDNGYGNAINVIHTARAYEREGVAAICIEDNVFPKRCSFYVGVRRELADPDEHAGKIKACVDVRSSDDFLVIARTEALIAGWGMEEALKRGHTYADAGADLILVHSKSPQPDEVLEFARRWDRDVPLVCVPTTYATTPLETLGEGGYRVVIFANQGLRSAIKAMRLSLGRIAEQGRASAADDLVVPLGDVYELIGVPQMKEDERAYLPAGGVATRAVVLAAGESPELGELTADRPKAMMDVKGKSLLGRQVETLNQAGIKDISVVVGWKKEAVDLPNLRLYEAPGEGGEVASLMAAAPELDGPSLVLYGDILFDSDIVVKLLQAEGEVVLAVDHASVGARKGLDLVRTERAAQGEGRMLRGDRPDALARIGVDLEGANGEWIGMMMLSEAGSAALKRVYDQRAGALQSCALTDLLQALVDEEIGVRCVDIYQGWMEIDTFEDYRRAWAQVK